MDKIVVRARTSLQRFGADAGVSLVEIVVAMVILALIAVAFLPMLVTGLRLAASNSTVATATQLIGEQMNLARSQTATCSALTAFANPATSTTTTTDGNGKVLSTTRSVTCPSSYPGTVRFTASVAASGSTTIIATATTLIYATS